MSQNYNVDDILEEIRRKKANQAEPPATYGAYEAPRRQTPDSPPAGMPDIRPIGTRRKAAGPAGPAAQRPARQRPADDSGWDAPVRPARAQPSRRQDEAAGLRPARASQEPSAPPRRKAPQSYGQQRPREDTAYGKESPSAREPAYGKEAYGREPSPPVREPSYGREAAYKREPEPRREAGYAKEAGYGREASTGESPRRPAQTRPPKQPDRRETAVPKQEWPPYRTPRAPQPEPRRQEPRQQEPRRAQERRPARPESTRAALFDQDAYEREAAYEAPYEQEAYLPEPQEYAQEAYADPYSDEAYAGDRDYGYEAEADRFEDDAPPSPTEDFSLHFSLDDDTAEDAVPQSARRSDPQDDGEESLVRSRWHQSFLEQELQEQPVPDDDYGTPEDAPYVEKDLKKLRTGLIVRTISMTLLVVLTAYMAFSIKYPPFAKLLGADYADPLARLPLPAEIIYPDKHPRIFMALMLVLCAVGALICANIIGAGFGALFRLRANSDTPAALAVLAVLVQGVVLMIYSTVENNQLTDDSVSVYIPVAMLVLLFTLVGKLMLTERIRRNFQYLNSDKEKYALLSVVNRDFARELSRGLGPEVDEVGYSARAAFITGFLAKSYTGDYSDNFYCVAAPVSFAGALLVGGVTGFLSKSPVLAVSAFAATMCVCAPLSSAIVPHLMLGRMSKWLCKRGAMLAGYETAEELAATGAVVIDEKDVFPGESVQLHGMKVFAEKRIDEAILDAASVILSCNGLMSGVFLNMIGGNQRMLKKVDGLIYEDGMGVSAWVDGKRVLIGSRELMQNHEVECPSRDFETRYTRGGRRVLYIANSGELSAMFVVSYNGEAQTAQRLTDLERRGIAVILYTTDPNVTSELVASVFGIRKGSVRVLPAKLHPEYNYLTRYREHVTAGCAHQGGLVGILRLLRASGNVCHSVRAGAITQLVGIIAGYGLMVAMAFTDSLSLASFYMVMVYGLGALAVTFLVSNFGKM